MAWFETWFNTSYYHILYKDRDFLEAESFITRLVTDIKLPTESTVIDLACGKGRHSIYLNSMGFNVIGLDLSEESIAYNKQFEKKELPSLEFHVHDMRNEIPYSKSDAVLNLFTSFGYFDDTEDDQKVFQSVHKILNPEGIFVLDFLNEQMVRNTLVPESFVTKENIDFRISKKIENQHVIKDIRFSDQGKDHHFFEKVKLHTSEEIEKLASNYGFECVTIYGDYQLNEFDIQTSPRCIHVFKKVRI